MDLFSIGLNGVDINKYLVACVSRPKHTKKKMTILFILVCTTTNSIQFINKPVFCFDFFHVVVLVLLAKQQQQKIVNLYKI
jgi:hypothetical protein